MDLRTSYDECLIFDRESNRMVPRFEVVIQIVGNLGSIFYEEAPLYAHSLSEAPEAEEILKGRIYPMIESAFSRDFNIDW